MQDDLIALRALIALRTLNALTILKYLPALFRLIFMTYLSHQDGAHTAETSRRLAKRLGGVDSERINWLNGKLRRWAHIAVFFVLTILVGIAFEGWLWL